MAGPRLPFEVIEGRGAKHMTKAEKAKRQAGEVKNSEPIKFLRAPEWLPEGLRSEFSRVSNGLIALMPTMVSRLDGDTIATYCMARQEWLVATEKVNDLLSEEARARVEDRESAEDTLEKVQAWSLLQERYFKTARACATDLGLTISSRCKLVVPEAAKQAPNAFEELLKKRREA